MSRTRRRQFLPLLVYVLGIACLFALVQADAPDPSKGSPLTVPNITLINSSSITPAATTTSFTNSATSSTAKIITSSSSSSSSSSNSTTPSQTCREGPECPAPCASLGCEAKGLSCILGVLPSCGGCVPSWCGVNPISTITASNDSNNNSSLIGGLVGGMVGLALLAFGGYIGIRYYKRSRAGLPFFDRGKHMRFGDDKLRESWAGMDVGSGLDVSHQSAVIPIGYFPGSNTNSVIDNSPNGVQASSSELAPPRAAFTTSGDRASVGSENPFDDLEDDVEIKRAVVTKPVRTLPRSPGSNASTSQNTLPTMSPDPHVSIVPDQPFEHMNPTHSMIIDHISPEVAPNVNRDSLASTVIISSGIAKVASPSTLTVPNAGLGASNSVSPSTAKPTLVRVDTLSRNNSAGSRRPPVSETATSSPLTSQFSPASSQGSLPNLTIQNPSSSNLSVESPFSDRHSVSGSENEGESTHPSIVSSPAASRPETELLSPHDRPRLNTDSMASNSTSLSSSDGEITIFWRADDPRRSAAESEASLLHARPDTLATERVISLAETEALGPRDTIATDVQGRIISLFGEEEEEDTK